METSIIGTKISKSLSNFSQNLKSLMSHYGYNQQDFSSKMQIAASTLSGYLNGKQPKYDFLITLKENFPEIKIDDMLFDAIHFTDEENNGFALASSSDIDLQKYYGSYYLYYMDNSKRNLRIEFEKNAYPSLSVKYAVLHIGENFNKYSCSEAVCCAVFGIDDRQEAKRIKERLDSCVDSESAYTVLSKETSYSLYTGKLHAALHIFLSLFRTTDNNDNMLIILHNTRIHHKEYSGGIGTVNSISTGRECDPIVQLIALSRDYAYITDDQIKSHLWFSHPDINVRNNFSAHEILRLAKSLYTNISSDSDIETQQKLTFSEKNIETLINSYLEYLVTNNIENNRLWYGRVSIQNDDDWYHILLEAEAFHKSNFGR